MTRKESVQEVLEQYLLTTDNALIGLESWLAKHQDNEILLHNHVGAKEPFWHEQTPYSSEMIVRKNVAFGKQWIFYQYV